MDRAAKDNSVVQGHCNNQARLREDIFNGEWPLLYRLLLGILEILKSKRFHFWKRSNFGMQHFLYLV